MSFSAQLTLDGTEMPILSSNINATSGANPGYSSLVIPRDCRIHIVVAGFHSELFGWMVAPDLMKEGVIRFSSRDGMSRSINLEFWDCYCVHYNERFNQFSSSPAMTEVVLSPAIVRFRNKVLEKPWKVTNINTKSAAAPISYRETARQEPTPEEEKQPLVEKVEGPFTEDGRLVEEMLAGNTYVFRATQISESSHDPYPLIKWALETDGSGELEILPASGLFKEKEIISYRYTPKAGEKARVYAYCQRADKEVSVEVPVVCFPFCVDRYKMPGLNEGGEDIAEDLTHGTGMLVTKRIYPPSVVESFKAAYSNNETISLATLSNRNDAFNKTYYTKEEIYSIDYEMKWYYYLVKILGNSVRWTTSKLLDLPESISAGAVAKYFNEHYTDEQLFDGFEDLATFYMALGELDDNIKAMIRKFKRNEGGVYESEALTRSVENHPSTHRYCEELQDYIAEKLKNSNGKVSELIEKEIDFGTFSALDKRRKKGKTTTNEDGKEIFFLRPQFNSEIDLFVGQRIALNDIWATDVQITAIQMDGNEYYVQYEVTLWDHFGLDLPDLQKSFNLAGRARALFAAWFTLQHLRGYKPFITKMHFPKQFKGNLAEGKNERLKKRKK